MNYAIILLGILYLFYYLIYKYILEFGTSYIYWHLWHTVLCAGLVMIFDVHPQLRSVVLGNCIISVILLFYVIVLHYDVLELISARFKKDK